MTVVGRRRWEKAGLLPPAAQQHPGRKMRE